MVISFDLFDLYNRRVTRLTTLSFRSDCGCRSSYSQRQQQPYMEGKVPTPSKLFLSYTLI